MLTKSIAVVAMLLLATSQAIQIKQVKRAQTKTSRGTFPVNMDIKDNQVAFYQYTYYGGAQMIIDATSKEKIYVLSGYETEGSDYNLGWWNDAISSIKIGKNVKVKLCRYQNCEWETYKPENAVILVGPYTSDHMGWAADYTSTIVVSPYDESEDPVVSIFGGDDFNCDTATVLGPGKYNSDELRLKNIDPYEIRGFRVPENLVLEIFDANYLGGQNAFIQGSSGPLGAVDLYAQKYGTHPSNSLGEKLGKFYRNVFSLKIGKANDIYPITAKWVKLESSWGNNLKVTVTQGLEIDTTKVSTTTFSASLTLGYKYSKGDPVTGGSEVSVSTSLGVQLSSSISNSIKKSTTVSAEKTCPKRGENQQVSMWQFQLTAEGALYGAENFICRYGENADTAPDCPSFIRCADAECLSCNE